MEWRGVGRAEPCQDRAGPCHDDGVDTDAWIALVTGLVGASAGCLAASAIALRQFRLSTDRAVERLSEIVVRESQSWYWTDEWQAGEAEADADIAAGRTTVLHSTEDLDEFLASRQAST